MNKKLIFSLVLLCSVCIAYGKEQSKSSTQPLNVLFILVDDLGWKDVGYNGSSFYETPYIDKLASQSMRFDLAYAASPMCSPTRVSIMTGKSPARTGVTQWLPGGNLKNQKFICAKTDPGIKQDEITIAEALIKGGYTTAIMGKWHMGSLKEDNPGNHGFDISKAIIETNRCSQFFPFRQKDPTYYFDDAKEGDNYTDKLTDEAIKFIGQKREKPFFLYLSHFAMHLPIDSKEGPREKYKTKAAKLPVLSKDEEFVWDKYGSKPHKLRQDDPEYAGELETLDGNIGRLMNKLEETGLDKNTIVIFTSDNGGRSGLRWGGNPTSNQPLRCGKTYLFEGGIRVPLLIRWPGITKGGSICNTPVVSTDFYPTLLQAAGLKLNLMQHADGQSLLPLLKNESIDRKAIYWHFPHYQGEGGYPASAIQMDNYKLIINYHFEDVLLFDLSKDPYEKTNLAEIKPEQTEKMKSLLLNWLKETGGKIPVKNPDYKSKTK